MTNVSDSLMTTILFDSWDSGVSKNGLLHSASPQQTVKYHCLSLLTNRLCFSLSHYYHKEIRIENFSTEVKHVSGSILIFCY